MTLLIALLSTAAYLFTNAMVFRMTYQKQMRAYLRWKNEAPEKYHRVQSRYGLSREVKRKNASLDDYLNIRCAAGPLAWSLAWPFLALYLPVHRFLHPPVKVPDQPKIKELESL